MPAPKRQPIAPTDDWHQLQLLVDWPEQLTYELIRPVVLFGRSVAQRARETDGAVRTIRRYGSSEALVSDGGGIFKAKQAMAIYQALAITKEQIDQRQAWQSYIESNFNVQR